MGSWSGVAGRRRSALRASRDLLQNERDRAHLSRSNPLSLLDLSNTRPSTTLATPRPPLRTDPETTPRTPQSLKPTSREEVPLFAGARARASLAVTPAGSSHATCRHRPVARRSSGLSERPSCWIASRESKLTLPTPQPHPHPPPPQDSVPPFASTTSRQACTPQQRP